MPMRKTTLFLELVLYICSYREIDQELILKQRCPTFAGLFIGTADNDGISESAIAEFRLFRLFH